MLKMIFFKFTLFLHLSTLAFAKEDDIIVIGEKNWKDLLIGEWIIEFHAPWCPACRTLQPVLEDLKPVPSFLDLDLVMKYVDENCRACFENIWEDLESWSVEFGIKVAKADVTDAPSFIKARVKVTALPAIVHVIDGQFREFKEPRGKDDFVRFIEENIRNAYYPISKSQEDYERLSLTLILYGVVPGVAIAVWFVFYKIRTLYNNHLNQPKTQPKKKAKSEDEKDKELEDKHDVAAEDLIAEAAEKKEAEETAKRDSKPDSGVEETGYPGSLRKRKSRKD